MHHGPSPSLAATLRALHGEIDVHVVAPALDNPWFARFLALAPGVDPVVGALGALAGGLPDLLTPDECASPALSAAIASLIGTDTGDYVLELWADVAPAGWGVAHATALINAVERNRCARWAAAALIGPTNDAAALLHAPWGIAAAIRRWGQATPDHPTAWMDDLASAERDRLVNALRTVPDNAAACWPWLPDVIAADIISRIDKPFLLSALAAYAAASPVARTGHADMLSDLMHCADQFHLDALTRLAVASRMDAAWTTVVQILHEHPDAARHVVAAAPWDDVPGEVQDAILSAADHSDVCAALAFARGERSDPPAMTPETARAFFAAVTPKVWTALPAGTKHAWRAEMVSSDIAVLAVRSLGPDPAFLAGADLDANVIAAVRRHAPNEASLRWTLLPVAVCDLSPDAVPAVVAALPVPPDPPAFVQIAGCRRDLPPALRDWITAHPTPHAYGTAATALHAVLQSITIPFAARCTALAEAFAGWSSEEATTLLAALPDTARAVLRPDPEVLADALTHPDRRDAFRQALDAIDSLPPAATRPALLALETMGTSLDDDRRQQAGAALAQALRNHGRIFADIVGALNDDARFAVLPRRDHPHDEAALFPLAVADPLVAHHLAHALWAGDMPAALDALMNAPFDALARIWRLLPEDLQQFVLGDRDALLREVAAPGHADALAQTLRGWNADDLLPLLALRMLIDDDEARRARGAALLARRPDVAAAILPLLREDLHMLLEHDPRIAVAGADLPPPSSPAPTPMLPRRRRRSR
jgi:hypothetical protein